jgi:hypothetical protein
MTPTNPIIETTKAGVSCSKAAAAAPECDTRIMSASRLRRRSKPSTSLKSAIHRARRIDFAAVK